MKNMAEVISRMPPELEIYLGEISPNEPVGFDALLHEKGRSLFTTKVSTTHARYYRITKQARRLLYSIPDLKHKTANVLMNLLMYRLTSLQNILSVLGKQEEFHISEGADFSRMIKSKSLLSCYHSLSENNTTNKLNTNISGKRKPEAILPIRTKLTDTGMISNFVSSTSQMLISDPSLANIVFDVNTMPAHLIKIAKRKRFNLKTKTSQRNLQLSDTSMKVIPGNLSTRSACKSLTHILQSPKSSLPENYRNAQLETEYSEEGPVYLRTQTLEGLEKLRKELLGTDKVEVYSRAGTAIPTSRDSGLRTPAARPSSRLLIKHNKVSPRQIKISPRLAPYLTIKKLSQPTQMST